MVALISIFLPAIGCSIVGYGPPADLTKVAGNPQLCAWVDIETGAGVPVNLRAGFVAQEVTYFRIDDMIEYTPAEQAENKRNRVLEEHTGVDFDSVVHDCMTGRRFYVSSKFDPGFTILRDAVANKMNSPEEDVWERLISSSKASGSFSYRALEVVSVRDCGCAAFYPQSPGALGL